MIENSSARLEWARNWRLVLGGTMGYSVINLHAIGIAAFVQPLERSFNWSRAEAMSGLTFASALGILIYMAGGACVDRFGARRVGLVGIVIVCSGVASLGLATGGLVEWIATWLYISCGIAGVQGVVWTSLVTARFEKSRGLAIAAVLNGSAVTATFVPIVATSLINSFGWRLGFAGVGLIWFIAAFPMAFLFFRQDRGEARGPQGHAHGRDFGEWPGLSLREALRTSAFWRIAFCMFAFIVYTMALSPNLIALLTEKGVTPSKAATIAAIMGVCGLVSRLATGVLLDRLPTLLVGCAVFVLPVIGGFILLTPTPGTVLLGISVACFGATVGAENDVLFYLVARYFGLRHLGVLLGAVTSGGAVAGTIAPIASGWLHDRTGSYDLMIEILLGLMALCVVATATMGRPDRAATARTADKRAPRLWPGAARG